MKCRILLVDDHPQVEKDLLNALERLGVVAEIDLRVPLDRERPFGCDLPQGTELENYDLAMIDLELFRKFRTPLRYSPDDLRGGTEVLPYLRQEAPWLAAIALSGHFTSEIRDFLVTAGSFGFDGALPKTLLQSGDSDEPELKRGVWDNLLEMAHERRRVAAIGESVYHKNDRVVEVEILEEERESRTLLKTMFFFARKVTLERLRGGFTGAKVFRAFAQLETQEALHEGEWLVKLHSSPRKLHAEAQAHMRMTRSGVDFARVVPLLWRSVLFEKGTAGIAYQFASGTVEAASMMGKISIDKICQKVAAVVEQFYGDGIRERGFARRIAQDWIDVEKVVQFADSSFGEAFNLIAALKDGSDHSTLNSAVRYQQCLLHGDLHLGNIMLGDRDLLIDFARSGFGPLALDAAKLVSDILLRDANVRGATFPGWSDDKAKINLVTRPLRQVFRLDGDDILLYDIFLLFFLCTALGYPDVSSDAKEWIRRVAPEFSVRVE
jgi:hypothetical protein